MNELTTYSMYSKNLNLDWNYGIHLPKNYKPNMPLLVLMHGAFGNQRSIEERFHLSDYLHKNPINCVILSIDGFNTFYIDRKIKMESAIMDELIPHVKKQFNTKETYLGGISMGGYGVLRLSLKYKNQFQKVFAISPAIWKEYNESTETSSWQVFRKNGVLDIDYWYSNHPNHFMGKTQTQYYIMTGKKDEVVPYKDVLDFNKKLTHFAKTKLILDEEGDHSWDYFNQCLIRSFKWIKKDQYDMNP